MTSRCPFHVAMERICMYLWDYFSENRAFCSSTAERNQIKLEDVWSHGISQENLSTAPKQSFCYRTGISVNFTGSRKLPTFGPHPGASVLDWCVWKRQGESTAVGFWHVRLRGGAGGQRGAPAHVTQCRAHSSLLMWEVFDKLVSAGCQLQRITSGSLAYGHGPWEQLGRSAWNLQLFESTGVLRSCCKLCCWLWRWGGTEMLTTDILGYETDENWPPHVAECTLRTHISSVGLD